MSWWQAIDDVAPLAAVFGDLGSVESTVELHEVALDRDGPTLRLRFDLTAFPTDPPAKWQAAGHDTVQVTVALLGVSVLQLSGAATGMRGELSAHRLPAGVGTALRFECDAVQVRAEGRFAAVTTVQGYCNRTA